MLTALLEFLVALLAAIAYDLGKRPTVSLLNRFGAKQIARLKEQELSTYKDVVSIIANRDLKFYDLIRTKLTVYFYLLTITVIAVGEITTWLLMPQAGSIGTRVIWGGVSIGWVFSLAGSLGIGQITGWLTNYVLYDKKVRRHIRDFSAYDAYLRAKYDSTEIDGVLQRLGVRLGSTRGDTDPLDPSGAPS